MDISDFFGKILDVNHTDGEKRLPSIGYEIISEDEETTHHAYLCGYRHFLFDPQHCHVIASLKRKWVKLNPFIEQDLFLTLKVPVKVDKYQGAQHLLVRVLSQLKADKLDLVLLHNNQPMETETSLWNSKWMELESLRNRNMVTYIGLMTNETGQLEQVHKRCRHKPDLIMYSIDLSQEEPLLSQLDQFQPFCTKHRVRLALLFNMPVLSHCQNVTGNQTPKVYGFTVSRDLSNILSKT